MTINKKKEKVRNQIDSKVCPDWKLEALSNKMLE
jgi:hypothetical protein